MGSGGALRTTFAVRPVVRTHAKPEPLPLARALRAARLDLEEQSARHVGRLESARNLRGRPILTATPARRQTAVEPEGGVLLRLHRGDSRLPPDEWSRNPQWVLIRPLNPADGPEC